MTNKQIAKLDNAALVKEFAKCVDWQADFSLCASAGNERDIKRLRAELLRRLASFTTQA